MRTHFAIVGFFAITATASCGFNPHLKDGKLSCSDTCPSGYVCRADKHCWLVGSQLADSGADGVSMAKDGVAADLVVGGGDGLIAEAGADISIDSTGPNDVGINKDAGSPDIPVSIDAGSSIIDAPVGTGGIGGDAGGGGGSGGGVAGSDGGIVGGISDDAIGGAGGSGDAAVPDAPDGQPDFPFGGAGGGGTGGTTGDGGTATGGVATGGMSTGGGTTSAGGIATAGGTVASGGSSGSGGAWGGTAPSCSGLGATCGPSGNDDCCKSLLVPGGTFYRSYDGVDFTDPNYPATVSDFYLDKYEITVGRFRQFVNAGMVLAAGMDCSSYSTWTDTPGDNENRRPVHIGVRPARALQSESRDPRLE